MYADTGEQSLLTGEKVDTGLIRVGKYSDDRRTRVSLKLYSGNFNATVTPDGTAGSVGAKASVITLSGQQIITSEDGDTAFVVEGDLDILGFGKTIGTQKTGTTVGFGYEYGWDIIELE